MNRSIVFLSALLLSGSWCTAQVAPENDSLFSKQQELFEKLNVFKAWDVTKGNPGVMIGCIDSGFDFYHPYLHGRLIPGYWADEVYHPETYQILAHGTLVAGLMVANSSNESGIRGLAPDCRVLTASLGMIEHPMVRRMNEISKNNPDMSEIDIAKEVGKQMREDTAALRQFGVRWKDFVTVTASNSIVYLVDKGVKLINMSMYTFTPELNEAFEYARKHDVLIVVGAGNANKEIPATLTNRDHIIVAGACDDNDNRWTVTAGGITQGSNWGEMLDVCAPVENLLVCQPFDPRFYQSVDGPSGTENVPYKGIYTVLRYGATSSAAPIVSSLAALVYSIAPHLTASEVKQAIIGGCDDIGGEGFDIHTGHGRVNYGKTIATVRNRRTE